MRGGSRGLFGKDSGIIEGVGKMNYAIILAAGKGTRMKTELPQCAYPLIRKPMVAYVVDNVLDLFDEVIVVVGYKRDVIMDILGENVLYAVQEEQLGTGHAVLSAENLVEDPGGNSLILSETYR